MAGENLERRSVDEHLMFDWWLKRSLVIDHAFGALSLGAVLGLEPRPRDHSAELSRGAVFKLCLLSLFNFRIT